MERERWRERERNYVFFLIQRNGEPTVLAGLFAFVFVVDIDVDAVIALIVPAKMKVD